MNTYRYVSETYYVLVMIAIFMFIVSGAIYIYSFIHVLYGLPAMWGRATAFLMNGLGFYALSLSMIDVTPYRIRAIVAFNMVCLVILTAYTIIVTGDYMDVVLAIMALLTSVVAMILFGYSVEKSRVLGGEKTNGYYHQ